jgi:hypothetical protein
MTRDERIQTMTDRAERHELAAEILRKQIALLEKSPQRKPRIDAGQTLIRNTEQLVENTEPEPSDATGLF